MRPETEPEFFQIVLQNIADGVFTVDQKLRITSFNRAAERITGVQAQKAIGRSCSDVFHSDLCASDCPIRKIWDTDIEVTERPARITRQDGRKIPIHINAAVLRDETGNVIGAVETFRDLSDLEQLRREIHSQHTVEDIVGKSEAFQKMFRILPEISESESTVLIEGPSGSGKELIARAIHNLGHRKAGPYVVVNCGTLPTNLVESELFGYKKGAFTDAKKDKPGRVKAAEGGTIFFDEIGDLLPETQGKLLRLLQEREYEPVGGTGPLKADVRVVAATNKKLPDMVKQGLFRDDLYFRLAVVRLSIPPLKERKEDIPYLIDHFIERFNTKTGRNVDGVTPAVAEILIRHQFPGNARELMNIIEYTFAFCHSGLIDVRHLPEELQPPRPLMDAHLGTQQWFPLQRAEAETVVAALINNAGHSGHAAEELGISRPTFWRKLTKYSIDPKAYRRTRDE